jgi:hypothetical protein
MGTAALGHSPVRRAAQSHRAGQLLESSCPYWVRRPYGSPRSNGRVLGARLLLFLMDSADNGARTEEKGVGLKLRLADQGEGWFWSHPAIEVDVVEQTWYHSRLYYKVRLQPPAERQESRVSPPGSGASLGPGLDPAAHRAAWLSSRWVGHEIRPELDSSALLWLAHGEDESAPPSVDTPYSARVMCRMMS